MCVPGATTSTYRALLPVEENGATVSSPILAVPIESDAPTAKIFGSKAGFGSVPV